MATITITALQQAQQALEFCKKENGIIYIYSNKDELKITNGIDQNATTEPLTLVISNIEHETIAFISTEGFNITNQNDFVQRALETKLFADIEYKESYVESIVSKAIKESY